MHHEGPPRARAGTWQSLPGESNVSRATAVSSAEALLTGLEAPHRLFPGRVRAEHGPQGIRKAQRWFFEYLNRFVQNWYYVGQAYTAWEYAGAVTPQFATVLPRQPRGQ